VEKIGRSLIPISAPEEQRLGEFLRELIDEIDEQSAYHQFAVAKN
jgi:hypothetical protein